MTVNSRKIFYFDFFLSFDLFSDNTVLVSLKHQGLIYEPGDHLAVFPTNSELMVQKLCDSVFFDNGTTVDTPVVLGRSVDNNNNGRFICATAVL